MKQKLKLLLLLICILNIKQIKAQGSGLGPLTPGGVFDTIFDKDGNKYLLSDLLVNYTPSSGGSGSRVSAAVTTSCNAGYFDLYFENGSLGTGASSVQAANQAVICQVFSDISNFISSPLTNVGNTTKVNIWVRDPANVYSPNPVPAGLLGSATQYYTMPNSSSTSGIVDGEIYKTIISGVDSYSNIGSPLVSSNGGTTTPTGTFFHGMVDFNFNSINWCTTMTTTPSAAQFDLYTVALHEVTHALGFASLINYNGNSLFGTNYPYYSRYDMFLRKGTTPLITNSGVCSLYNYQFNSALSPTVITPGCSASPPTGAGTNSTDCTNSLTYMGNVTVPIYTPICYEAGSSLSHFEDMCYGPPYGNDLYFVMCNATGQGVNFMKRFLKPEERTVLCDLGYNVNTTYGSAAVANGTINYGGSPCPGIQVAGVNDGITNTGTYTHVIPVSTTSLVPNIINNDYNTVAMECLQIVTGNGTITGATTTSFNYTPLSQGLHLLRYIPVAANGNRGNITYIYIYGAGNCTPSPCNIVSNGTFENATGGGYNAGVTYTLSCWENFYGTADLFASTYTATGSYGGYQTGVNTLNSTPAASAFDGLASNTHFIGIWAGNGLGIGLNGTEAYENSLSSPLVNGAIYKLGFWAVTNNYLDPNPIGPPITSNTLVPTPVRVYSLPNIGTTSTSNLTSFVSLPAGATLLGNTTFMVPTAVPGSMPWTYHTTTFTYTGTSNANAIAIMIDFTQLPSSVAADVFIDNVSIMPFNDAPVINTPSVVCIGTALNNLAQYVSPPGGTFAGQGVTNSSGVFNFNAAQTMTTGTYSISYTYTTGGCAITDYKYITIAPIPTITITPTSPTITTVCAGAVSVLTGSGASTYTWAAPACTSGCNTAVKGFVVNATTIYTLNGTNAQGCVGTNTIQITAVPKPTVTVTSATICAGQSATLTASGANTYTWNPGASTASSIVVAPSVTTIYTVAGQNTGCTASSVKTATVTIAPNIPVFTITPPTLPIVSNVTGTNTVGFTSSITNTTGLTFAWSNGVTTPTATYSITQSQIVSLTTGNSYCGTSTQSICVNYVAASCDGSYPSLSSSLSSFTATNQTYRVASNATITISGVVYFNGCSLLMSTGSVINVTPGSSLIFSDSKLYSCDGMWYGIKTLYNATSVGIVEFRNTTVEDAYKAVDADNTINTLMPIIYANGNSKFNKNYIDFSLDHTVVHTGLNTTFYLEQISMTSQTSTTSPGSNLKCSNYYNPTIKARSYAGIYASKAGDLDVTSNNAVFGNNVFKNKDYGMYLNKTNADVYNANFIDMTSYKDSPICDINGCTSPLPYGIGIFSTNAPKYLNVKPLGSSTTVNTTFSNVGYSILANKTPTVDVQYCSFDNPLQSSSTNFITGLETSIGNTAVYLLDVNGTARVNKNTINKTYTGISLNYSVTTTAANFLLSVGQNTLTAGTGTLTTGINIVSVLTTPFNGTITNQVVAANTITNARSTGVRLQNVTGGLRVSGNTITLTSANGIKDGILLNGNNNNVRVDNNTIDGNLTGAGVATYNLNSCGIRSINSAGCKIQCNTVKQIGKGIEYNGGNSSPGDGFFKNTLQYPMRRGLVLSNGGLIGMQGSNTGTVTGASANVWTGAWPAANIADPNQTLVGGGAASSNAANSLLWVRNTEVPYDNYFSSPSILPNAYSTINGINTITTAIVNDYTTCPTMLTQGAKLASTSNGNSIEDRDADFVKYITTLLPAASTTLTPQDKYMLKQFMFDDLTQTPSANATLVNFCNQQQNTAIDAYAHIDNLLASGNINLANSKNAQASTSNDINQTQHDFNALYINGINSQADFDQLSYLAKLCPNQYGNAVFQARALLQILTYQYVEYSDSCYTDKLNGRFGYDDTESSVSVSEGVMAKLYPNPNNGNFTLAYDLKKYNVAEVYIYDVTGKVVYKTNLDNLENIKQINTNNLQSGIYFVQLRNDKTLLWTDKLMISK